MRKFLSVFAAALALGSCIATPRPAAALCYNHVLRDGTVIHECR